MIEPEMAFYELEDNMALAEEFLQFIIRYVLEHCREDLEFFNERIEKTVLSTLEHVAESKFGHITYTEAIQELKKSGKTWEFPVEWGVDLQTEHERFLSEELFKKPVIVTDYPKDIKPFYMRAQRRQQDRPGHGRLGSASRRDHRRQPARRPPRCALAKAP